MHFFTSRWLILAESLVLLLQTILAFAIAPLVLLFSPFEWPLLLVTLLGVWGMLSLWRYFFSFKQHTPPPRWATVGLAAGLVASVGLFILLDTTNRNVQLAQLLLPLIAVHWYLMKRLDIQVSWGADQRKSPF
ncbi:MAG: hypothetical protein VXW65_08635 [Pseudomonadota bacterium]|nr:hypothetical protein [Pseudomonadota bacterium]